MNRVFLMLSIFWKKIVPGVINIAFIFLVLFASCEKDKDNILNNSAIGFNVRIYPNPVINKLYVTSESSIQSVGIINPLGHTTFSSSVNSFQTAIDVSHFPASVYKIIVETSDGTYSQKIIVIK